MPRVTVWAIAKWPVLAVVVVLIVAMLYYATPNAKQPKFRWISLGALLAIVVLGARLRSRSASTSRTSRTTTRPTASLAGVIVFLLWLWIANLALLFGAEFDAELERGRELQAGIEAEEELQLPPRDTRKSEKSEKSRKRTSPRAAASASRRGLRRAMARATATMTMTPPGRGRRIARSRRGLPANHPIG